MHSPVECLPYVFQLKTMAIHVGLYFIAVKVTALQSFCHFGPACCCTTLENIRKVCKGLQQEQKSKQYMYLMPQTLPVSGPYVAKLV